jgi:hypothetical protein
VQAWRRGRISRMPSLPLSTRLHDNTSILLLPVKVCSSCNKLQAGVDDRRKMKRERERDREREREREREKTPPPVTARLARRVPAFFLQPRILVLAGPILET